MDPHPVIYLLLKPKPGDLYDLTQALGLSLQHFTVILTHAASMHLWILAKKTPVGK